MPPARETRPQAEPPLIALTGVEKTYRMGRVDYRALRGIDRYRPVFAKRDFDDARDHLCDGEINETLRMFSDLDDARVGRSRPLLARRVRAFADNLVLLFSRFS